MKTLMIGNLVFFPLNTNSTTIKNASQKYYGGTLYGGIFDGVWTESEIRTQYPDIKEVKLTIEEEKVQVSPVCNICGGVDLHSDDCTKVLYKVVGQDNLDRETVSSIVIKDSITKAEADHIAKEHNDKFDTIGDQFSNWYYAVVLNDKPIYIAPEY